jgi:cytochrome c peroxidase
MKSFWVAFFVLPMAFIVESTLCRPYRLEAIIAAPRARNERNKFTRPDPADLPVPDDNPQSKLVKSLGEKLFFDPKLSKNQMISCAACHIPSKGFEDGEATSKGVSGKRLRRHTPTLENLAWAQAFFWDGRAETLEIQAIQPILAADEMGLAQGELLQYLKNDPTYKDLFQSAFPDEGISVDTTAKALANFQRELISPEAPFDRWVAGNEEAISESAKRGFDLFVGKANCSRCHSSWRFTDDSFHDIGVDSKDLGRAEVFPGVVPLEHAFKTPTLRNVAIRPPYFHNGTGRNLQAVIELYNQGGIVKRPSLSSEIRPLGLTQKDIKDLIEFLETLTSETDKMSQEN